MDLDAIKVRSRAVWASGDYAPTSRQLEPVSEALVAALGIGPDERVLDVAAGHGNCAIAAARRGVEVVASDFSPEMIEHGRARTEAAGLDISWREADAADLPFLDGGFDRVTSVFGAIFAPEQEAVAAELSRVTAPGGVVGLTAWPPDGVIGRMVRIVRRYGPPRPDGLPDPMAWGDPGHAETLFRSTGCDLTFTSRTVTWSYRSWEDWRRALEAHGLLVGLRETLPEDEYAEMLTEVRSHIADHADAGDAGVSYETEYLEILARVPG